MAVIFYQLFFYRIVSFYKSNPIFLIYALPAICYAMISSMIRTSA